MKDTFSGGATWVDRAYDENYREEVLGIPRFTSLRDGLFYATGCQVTDNSTAKRKRIPAELWDFLRLEADAVTARGGTYHFIALEFHRISDTDNPPKKRGRKPGAGAYDDTASLSEMKKLCSSGEAKSPHQAANMIAGRVQGAGTIESKVSRLLSKYNKKYGSN